MVEINYCPRCKKAERAHLVKRALCKRCLEEYKVINVSRSKYFIIQLPILMLGLAFIIYTIFLFINDPRKIAEVFGNLMMAIAFFLFALGFQFMDSKAMEEEAVEVGRHKYPFEDDKGDNLIFRRRRSMLTGLPVKSRSARSRELLLREPLKIDEEDEKDKWPKPRPSTSTIQRSLTSFESPNKKSPPRKIRKPL